MSFYIYCYVKYFRTIPLCVVPTAQIVITLGISLTIIMTVALLGASNFILNFLSILMPGGCR